MRQFKISERLTPRNSRATMLYMTEVDRTKVMDAETESKIAYRAAAGDEEAREKLVMANLRFVLSVAKMYASKPEDFNDLVAAGNEGLIEASGKFDPSRGFKFISFAVWYIRKEMIKYLSEHSRTIKIPTNQAQTLKAVADTAGFLSAVEGRDVSNEEALEHLKETDEKFSGVGVDLFKSAAAADLRPASLQQELNHEKDAGTLLDVLEAEGDKADESVWKMNERMTIDLLMKGLSSLEKQIIYKYFGLDDDSGGGETFRQIGDKLGYTPEAIRLKVNSALKKMRLRNQKMKEKGNFLI